MKTLFLLRHARAENAATGLSDLDRALSERGKEEAQTIGTLLKQENVKLDFVLCSTAKRARETAELVLAAAELAASVRYDERIYEASPFQLLEVISEIEADASVALVVGHNPGIAELLELITDRAEPMATCTLAKIDLDAREWSRIREIKATLDWIVKPEPAAARPLGRDLE